MSEFPAAEPRVTSAPRATAPPVEILPVDPFIASIQSLGTILKAPSDQDPPPGWEWLDGSTRRSADYPQFAQEMGITDATFTLPAPQRREGDDSPVGHMIKLADAGDPNFLEI